MSMTMTISWSNKQQNGIGKVCNNVVDYPKYSHKNSDLVAINYYPWNSDVVNLCFGRGVYR